MGIMKWLMGDSYNAIAIFTDTTYNINNFTDINIDKKLSIAERHELQEATIKVTEPLGYKEKEARSIAVMWGVLIGQASKDPSHSLANRVSQLEQGLERFKFAHM